MPGRVPHESEIITLKVGMNIKNNPGEGAEICEKLDYCAGLSQNIHGQIIKLESIFLQNFTRDENWTTVALLSARSNQWEDTDQLAADLCCPEQPKIPKINIGRQEVPMEVRLIKYFIFIKKQNFRSHE